MTGGSPDIARRKLSPFSVILIMVALCIVGAAMIPLLNISYEPVRRSNSVGVSYGWSDASARILEQEVTSKMEGVFTSISGVSSVNSVSRRGSGSITVNFKRGTNMSAARFEVASSIRHVYPKLPPGVSYPRLSLSTTGTGERPIIVYNLNANLTPYAIREYADNNIAVRLSRIDGVNSVEFSGSTPFQYVITFDPERARAVGVSASDLASAFNGHYSESTIGSIIDRSGDGGERVTIKMRGAGSGDMESIPIKNAGGKIVYLRDFARVSYEETPPSSYFRINGLNTINISIYPEKGVNIIETAAAIRDEMKAMEPYFPAGFSALLVSDASEYVNRELEKVTLRLVLSFVILMLFVLAVSRNFRYLLIIFVTLAANILVALIFYWLFDVQIHLYSLAGITISLGLIIDTSIIMVDHYGYYRDRRAFISILGALLTTIGSLSVIYFLPEGDKANLTDFVAVIMINLTVSLVIAYLFIPSLVDKLPVRAGISRISARGRRRISRFTRAYRRFILWGRGHRWVFITAGILGFGLPVHLLPAKMTDAYSGKSSFFAELYDKTIGGKWYQEHKNIFETALGGSMRAFSRSSGPIRYDTPQRTELIIQAAMPEGCTVHQLNEVVRSMENYLSQFDEIEMFQTSVSSYSSSRISVTFREEFENGGFPVHLKNMVKQIANNFGGATWRVTGVDENNFNNNIYIGDKPNQIRLSGYNYDMLYRYAEDLVDTLALNQRVDGPEIYGNVGSGNAVRNEYYIEYDSEKIVAQGINLRGYYNFLSGQLYSTPLRSLYEDGEVKGTVLVSSERDNFDLWHITNDLVDVGGTKVRLSDIGTIEKRRSGNDIYKYNQEYVLYVAFDFIGNWELSGRVLTQNVERLNKTLPLGYSARNETYGAGRATRGQQVSLLLLVMLIIYFICGMLFESLRKPLLIILNIPVAMIGAFLIFAVTGINIDQGAYASFVLLCGLVVNAGIYIVNEFNIIQRSSAERLKGIDIYLKAYNRKIIPILLTIFSTVLGLIPFIYKGSDEVFWYSFAIGVMGGMVFSVVALVVYMPIFMPIKHK